MARGNSLINGPRGTGESVAHVNAVRLRLVGSGTLNMTLKSLGPLEQELTGFTMAAVTDKQPTRLANFKNQRVALEVYTDEINEWFKINRVILYVKPIAVEYPSSFSG